MVLKQGYHRLALRSVSCRRRGLSVLGKIFCDVWKVLPAQIPEYDVDVLNNGIFVGY